MLKMWEAQLALHLLRCANEKSQPAICNLSRDFHPMIRRYGSESTVDSTREGQR